MSYASAFRTIGAKRLLATLLFPVSVLMAVGVPAACDSGNSQTPTPTSQQATPAGGASQVSTAGNGPVLFMRYCNQCHPGGYMGAGPSLIQKAQFESDDSFKHTIRNGQGRMPGFGPDLIPDADLDPLIAYIRTLK